MANWVRNSYPPDGLIEPHFRRDSLAASQIAYRCVGITRAHQRRRPSYLISYAIPHVCDQSGLGCLSVAHHRYEINLQIALGGSILNAMRHPVGDEDMIASGLPETSRLRSPFHRCLR
jgi:hypothetical protein